MLCFVKTKRYNPYIMQDLFIGLQVVEKPEPNEMQAQKLEDT